MCVCVFSPFAYLLIVCCTTHSLGLCSPLSYSLALSLTLCYSPARSECVYVCVCVSGTDFREIFRRRLRLRLSHSSESNDRARLSLSHLATLVSPVYRISYFSCLVSRQISLQLRTLNAKKVKKRRRRKVSDKLRISWAIIIHALYSTRLFIDICIKIIIEAETEIEIETGFISLLTVRMIQLQYDPLRSVSTSSCFADQGQFWPQNFHVDSRGFRSLPRNIYVIYVKVREKR